MKSPMNVRWLMFEHRKGRGEYHTAVVDAGGHRVEVTASPTGRNVYVYLDGVLAREWTSKP